MPEATPTDRAMPEDKPVPGGEPAPQAPAPAYGSATQGPPAPEGRPTPASGPAPGGTPAPHPPAPAAGPSPASTPEAPQAGPGGNPPEGFGPPLPAGPPPTAPPGPGYGPPPQAPAYGSPSGYGAPAYGPPPGAPGAPVPPAYGPPELLEPPAAPAPPPAPPEPLRPVAAALLNLTGLGLGYALLRAWLPAALCWAATAGLLLIALPADVDGVPGGLLVGYLALLVLAAADAARRARRTALALRLRAPLAAALGVVLLAVPAASAFAYEAARDEAVEDMLLERLADADRLVADQDGQDFASSERAYRSALDTYRDLVRDHGGSRAADRVPDRLDAYYKAVARPYADGRYCQAIAPLTYLRTLPDRIGENRLGRLATWPDDRLATSLYECGSAAVDRGDGTHLQELLTTFPDSAAAGKVIPALGAAIDDRTAELKGPDPCSATEKLTRVRAVAASLPGGKGGSLAARAERAVQSGEYACGVDEFKDGQFTEAAKRLRDYADTYKNSGKRERARTIAIAAEVAAERPQAGRKLPAQRGPGSGQEFVVKNDGASAVEVLFTGPATGTVKLDACAGCTPYASRAEGKSKACKASRSYPQKTLRLPPGEYHFLYKRGTGGTGLVRDHSDGTTVQGGYRYTDCTYVVSGGIGGLSPRT
ncbi:hypothetical protein ACIG3E_15325 [Streptomyces sp. NPDC053474]|uniref:hypothetical protein n=1 Tax=Streptomyces sp. NPDC053474 TaxID=3365704 RepID=UPI0037D06B92